MLSSFHRAVELARGDEGLIRVDLDDGQHALARTVVVATGARWRTLAADNVQRFTGAGVYHAAMATDAERCRGENVIVVGGGNSAGQAAVQLSGAARSVRVVIRGDGLAATMSRYLLERIESRPNIEVMTGTEVSAVHGDDRMEHADLRNRADGNVERVAVSAVFVMIGADPCTEAVHTMLALDEAGYIKCGGGAATCDGPNRWHPTDRQPHLLESVWPGVFVAGDVRAGATKRVAGAVGDGALACASPTTCSRPSRAVPASKATIVDAGGRELRVSSPDRVIFPVTERSGAVTKLDIVEYYLAVGDGIMRALARRPTTLERWPKGVHPGIVVSTREKGGGDAFFQKRVPRGAPDYVETARIEFPSGRHADEVCPTELAVVGWPLRWGRSPSIRGRCATTTSTTRTSCGSTWTLSRGRTSPTPCVSPPRRGCSWTSSATPATRRPRAAAGSTSTSGSRRAGASPTSATPRLPSAVSSSVACRAR